MSHPYVGRFGIQIVLTFIVLVIFTGVCRLDFIAYDDEINIFANPFITHFSAANLGRYWSGLYQNLYIPLTYSVWTVLAWISPTNTSGTLSPFLFHAANLFFHLGSTWIVFAILRKLLRKEWGAAAGALLFALHPLQVEAVAWATGLKDVLSGFFALASLWQYLCFAEMKGTETRWNRHYVLAGALFLCAMLAKPSTVTIPLVMGVLGSFWLARPQRETALDIVPFLFLALPVVLLTRFAQPGISQAFIPDWWQRPLIAGDALSFYGYKFLLPFRLGPDYGRPPEFVLQHGWSWLTGIAPILLGGVVLFRGNRTSITIVLLLFFFLLPVLGLVSFDFQKYSTVADRYFYLAMLAPSFALGHISGMVRQKRRWILVFFALALGLFGTKSMAQILTWQDGFSLYRNALQVNPNSWLACNNLGILYEELGENKRAFELYQRALTIRPKNELPLNNIGVIYKKQGMLRKAEEMFRRALSINPGYPDALANLGDLARDRTDLQLAVSFYSQALELTPFIPGVAENLGTIYLQLGRRKEAISAYKQALKLKPAPQVYSNLGALYQQEGQFIEAIECFRKAISGNRELAEPYNNLGLVLMDTGRLEEAVQQFKLAAKKAPSHPMPVYNLGRAYFAQSRLEEALGAYRQSVAVDSNFAQGYHGLAQVARQNGQLDIADSYESEARRRGYEKARGTGK